MLVLVGFRSTADLNQLLIKVNGKRETDRVTKRASRIPQQRASTQNPDLDIWSSMLDGRYTVAVHRLGRYLGEPTICDGTMLLYRQEVTLMYGAIFGPDVSDVSKWQDTATTVVDGLKYLPEIPSKGRTRGGPVA